VTTDRHPCHPAGFEPAIPLSERPLTHALDRMAARIGVEEVSGSGFAQDTSSLDVCFFFSFFSSAIKCQENTTVRPRPLPDPSQFISDLSLAAA
jgi:hypothetical protein